MAKKISLEQVEGITVGLIERMKSLNITSVEELLAYHTAVRKDTSVLSKALNISEQDLESIIKKAEKLLPKDVLKTLTTSPPEDEMPFGTLNPEDKD